MKKCFTTYWVMPVLLLIWLIPAHSQSTWEVNVSNFSFNPPNLTIEQGDQVVWTNTGGTHNVNGTTATFPSNPVSFGNSVQGAPWEYSFTFEVLGQYNYQCDPHAGLNMVGTVTVNTPTSIDEIGQSSSGLVIWPSPVNDFLTFEFKDDFRGRYETLTLFNLSGAKLLTRSIRNTETLHLDMAHLPSSIYIYQLSHENGETLTGKVVKE